MGVAARGTWLCGLGCCADVTPECVAFNLETSVGRARGRRFRNRTRVRHLNQIRKRGHCRYSPVRNELFENPADAPCARPGNQKLTHSHPFRDYASAHASDCRIYPPGLLGALSRRQHLKHRLALENTSGLSWLAAQQDFGAKLLADNLDALAVRAAACLKGIPVNYKINRTNVFAHLKRCLPRWLLVAMPSPAVFSLVAAERARNLIRFEPGDARPRPAHCKPHRKHAYKSTC